MVKEIETGNRNMVLERLWQWEQAIAEMGLERGKEEEAMGVIEKAIEETKAEDFFKVSDGLWEIYEVDHCIEVDLGHVLTVEELEMVGQAVLSYQVKMAGKGWYILFPERRLG